MTGRTRVLTVLLDQDYRADDVEAIENAISLIRGVAKVDHIIRKPSDNLAIESAKYELRRQMLNILV